MCFFENDKPFQMNALASGEGAGLGDSGCSAGDRVRSGGGCTKVHLRLGFGHWAILAGQEFLAARFYVKT